MTLIACLAEIMRHAWLSGYIIEYVVLCGVSSIGVAVPIQERLRSDAIELPKWKSAPAETRDRKY